MIVSIIYTFLVFVTLYVLYLTINPIRSKVTHLYILLSSLFFPILIVYVIIKMWRLRK